MSMYVAKAKLTSTSQQLLIPLPRDGRRYHLIVRAAGTWVATLAIASSTNAGVTFTTRTTTTVSGTTQGNPTGNGVFAIDCQAAAHYAKVSLSAYTSGTVVLECTLMPYSS